MSRPAPGPLAVALTALGIVAGGAFAGPAGMPYQGTWKVTGIDEKQGETTAWLVRFDSSGKPPGKVVASLPAFRGTTLESVEADPRALHFTLRLGRTGYEVSAYPPRGKARPAVLTGSVLMRQGPARRRFLLRMEKTDLKELNPDTARRAMEGTEEVQKLAKVFDAGERARRLKALADKYAGKPIAYYAWAILLDLRLRQGADAKAVREAAEGYVKEAAAYGREMELVERANVGTALLNNDKTAGLGLEFARKASRLLADSDPPEQQLPVLNLLAAAVRRAGGKEDKKGLKRLDERIGRLEERLDREFRVRAVPFGVKKFAGGKGKAGHVVLVELFTGAHARPALAADIAFDAALRRYDARDVALVSYHLHLPPSDALAGPAGEARGRYYGVAGTPAFFVDGREVEGLAGADPSFGKDRFDKLCAAVEKAPGADSGVRLKLKVGRDGDRLSVQAQVEGLEAPGEKLRLRLALVEEEVRYTGFNTRRLHNHVVRDMPGGPDGFELRRKASTVLLTVSLADVRRRLEEHLKAQAKVQPFATAERPLDLKRLKLVAFVQDDSTHSVLQAVQADVPAPK